MSLSVDAVMALSPVIPVITIERVEDAAPLAGALVAGGLRALEVTLRTPAALDAIRAMADAEGAVVGAGTCLSANDVMLAVEAGARFIVTPGLSAATVAAAREANVPILPGVATASELMEGLDLGLDRFKFFPAEQAGGMAMLKALAGPFGKVRFCPTGGITLELARQYLKLSNVGCVGGGWVCPKKMIDEADWPTITQFARESAALTRG